MTLPKELSSELRIHVLSAGYGVKNDYRWVEATPTTCTPVARSEVDGGDLLGLVDGNPSPAFLILRNPRKRTIAILVGSLVSSRRMDFSNTRLRSALSVSAPDSDQSESVCCGVGVALLNNPSIVVKAMDEAIETAETESIAGFTVEYAKVIAMLATVASTCDRNEDTATSNPKTKMAQSTSLTREQLADELRKFRLPRDFAFPVLSSDLVTLQEIKERGFWRTISSSFSNAEWVDVLPSSSKPDDKPTAGHSRLATLLRGKKPTPISTARASAARALFGVAFGSPAVQQPSRKIGEPQHPSAGPALVSTVDASGTATTTSDTSGPEGSVDNSAVDSNPHGSAQIQKEVVVASAAKLDEAEHQSAKSVFTVQFTLLLIVAVLQLLTIAILIGRH